MKYRGVAYYPEYWPEERWAEDIRLMLEAHINMVRIGEFAWVAMEPSEGEFTIDWLHRLVKMLGENGINVLMCTPTAAPPAWLTTNYPEVKLVDEFGHAKSHGIRRHYCPTSNLYQKHCNRIVERLSTEFAQYQNVIAWQIDNELTPECGVCHCESCQQAFREWLRNRYKTLDEMNRIWGTRFWSGDYTDWGQVRLPIGRVSPGIRLDAKRFRSDVFVDFAQAQYDIIKRNHPHSLVTTNGMGPLFEPVNYYKLFDKMDFAAVDYYWDIATLEGAQTCFDCFRSYKQKPFWITETGISAITPGKAPEYEQFRSWAFSALARGCESYDIFRWRTCLSGQEQELQGVIEISGIPHRRFESLKKLYTELEELWPLFENEPLPKAEVAVVMDYDVYWSFNTTDVSSQIDYLKYLAETITPFLDRNIMVDVIPPSASLESYKLVMLPMLTMVDSDFSERLREYVKSGGTLLSLPQLACRDRGNTYIADTPPVGLHDLFGVTVNTGMYLQSYIKPDEALFFAGGVKSDEIPTVKLTLNDQEISGTVRTWMEDIEATGTIAGTYADNSFAGMPFMVTNDYGKGGTVYLAACPSSKLLSEIVETVLSEAGVTYGCETPKYIETVRRGKFTFAINHTDQPADIKLGAGKAVVGDLKDGIAKLGAFGVCMIVIE